MTETKVKYELGTDKREQLSIPVAVIDHESNSITQSVIEKQNAKHQAIQRYLDRGEKETIACVGIYQKGKNRYYRLSYRIGRRVKHIHIRGGSTISELAQYRAKKLQEMIDRGAELGEVIAATNTFNSKKN